MKSQKKMKTALKFRMISGFSTLVLVIAIAVCLFFTLQSLSLGYVSFGGTSMFRVVTGSMEPEIPVGSLLVSKKADVKTISVDDIVCFRSKEQSVRGIIITHRVIEIFTTPDGSTVLQTKGDANLTADVNVVTQDNLIGRVVWHTGDGSTMAKVINFVTSDFGFLACIILPVVLIAVWIFKDAIKSMKKAISDAESMLKENQVKSAEMSDVSISKEEYEALYNKIEQEVRKELEQDAEKSVAHGSVQTAKNADETQKSAEVPTDTF